MNRRDFIQLSLTASALSLLPSLAGCASRIAGSHPHPKRGIGLSTKDSLWRQKLTASNAHWFYSWGPNLPEGTPREIEFVPMIFGKTTDAKLADVAAQFQKQKSRRLLGLNEPDQGSQGNVSVEAALALWPKLMALGLPLGSPACVHPDKEWMKAFMKGIERGVAYVHDEPDKAFALMRPIFKDMDPGLMRAAFDEAGRSLAKNLATEDAAMAHAQDFTIVAGLLKPADKRTSFQGLYTNAYLP